MDLQNSLRKINEIVNLESPYNVTGKIIGNQGLAYQVQLKSASIGSSVEFICEDGKSVRGEVVALSGDYCYVMPYNELSNVNNNTKVILKDNITHIYVSNDLIGRVVDFNAKPIDGKGELKKEYSEKRSIYHVPTNPLNRKPIDEALSTGVRSIDCFTSVGKGQRIAIMAGSGVGKSVLMGMISKNTTAQVNVIALIGERGREVVEFIENELGPEGMENTIVVCSTSDTSALMRIKATYTATTIAEYFRDQGKDVLLMVDSLTRFAMAMREVGMSVGEPPGPKGYGPSVFAKLPKLMERAGYFKEGGSITGIYTVLVEGGDFDEPISDSVRSISDGHIALSRELASKGHYPAIDVLESVSRVMTKVVPREHGVVANYLRDLLSAYKESEDLINVGAYAPGSNDRIDKAVSIIDDLNALLKQEVDEVIDPQDLFDFMVEIARKAEKAVNPDLFVEENNEKKGLAV